MKYTLTAVAVIAVLAGCASKPVTNSDEPIRNQKLSTSFVSEGIKIETNCAWYKPWKSDSECNIVAIEAVGIAATNGNSTNNLRTGLIRAEMQAKANVSHFITEEVTSNRVTSTIAKNIEKAQDKINKGATDDKTVEMSDKEAKNISARENLNDTAHNVTNTIRANSRSILRGFKIVNQEVTGDQEVKVVVRWDLESDRTATMLRKKFQ